MDKKGFIWVSAVLYIALGIVAITLVMTAGLPLINKMKDRNTILQTKDLMHTIDKNIWQVRSEGVGSRRFLEPVIIKGGKLAIDGDNNKIEWEMKTKAKIMEACKTGEEEDWCVQSEGNLKMIGQETIIIGEYLIILRLDYGTGETENIDLIIPAEGDYTSGSTLTGKYALSIENSGNGKITLTVI